MTDLDHAPTAAGIYDYQSSYELEYHAAVERERDAAAERDSYAQMLREVLAEYRILPAAADSNIDPYRLTTLDLARITDALHDEWSRGTAVDDLDVAAQLRDWGSGR